LLILMSFVDLLEQLNNTNNNLIVLISSIRFFLLLEHVLVLRVREKEQT